jgi:hypothetical protein
MSAPYTISLVSPWRERDEPAPTFGAAIVRAMSMRQELVQHESVRVIGDGYDCDMDQDGYFESSDGLTDEERELLEELDL